jgi:hypothetical protein
VRRSSLGEVWSGPSVYDRDALLASVDLPALADQLAGPRCLGFGAPTWHCPSEAHDLEPDGTAEMVIFSTRSGGQRSQCTTCGAGGTAVDLVTVTQGISIADALDVLAGRVGAVSLPAVSRSEPNVAVGAPAEVPRPAPRQRLTLVPVVDQRPRLLGRPAPAHDALAAADRNHRSQPPFVGDPPPPSAELAFVVVAVETVRGVAGARWAPNQTHGQQLPARLSSTAWSGSLSSANAASTGPTRSRSPALGDASPLRSAWATPQRSTSSTAIRPNGPTSGPTT